MKKHELVQYLLNLHTLMLAIDPTPVWMAKEYTAHWDQFKEMVKKEQEDEART